MVKKGIFRVARERDQDSKSVHTGRADWGRVLTGYGRDPRVIKN